MGAADELKGRQLKLALAGADGEMRKHDATLFMGLITNAPGNSGHDHSAPA
jgi:hypothetical protein